MTKPRYKMKDGKMTTDSGGMTFVADSLTNIMNGLGGQNDPRTYNQFTFGGHGQHDYMFQNPMHLYAAYRSSWLARQIVGIKPSDALKSWRQFNCKQAEDIGRLEKKLRVKTKFTNLAKAARLSGGAIMVMMIDGQDLSKELDVTRVKKGSLKSLHVFDRYELSYSQQNITNPLDDNFLLPEYYMLSGGQQMVHHSNVIRLNGEELPRLLQRMEGGWGDSVLRQLMTDLTDVTASCGGIASMLQKANQDIIKMAGVKDARTTEAEQAIVKRAQLFKMGMANHSLGVLDETEELVRLAISFGGTSDALNQLMIWISGAADIPMTRLFGVQTKGMGDSGEGDMKNYNNSLTGDQESKYREPLEKLDEVLVRSALGNVPDDCDWDWMPVYQENGTTLAQQRSFNSQADQADLDMGIATKSQIMRRREADDIYYYPEGMIEKQEKYDQEQFKYMIEGSNDADGDNAPDVLGGAGEAEEGNNQASESEA